MLIMILLLVLYYLVPLDRSFNAVTAFGILVNLFAVLGIFVWQIYTIIESDYPRLRAVEALATAVPLFLLVFAFTYSLIDNGHAGSFSEQLSRNDALYFTITVFSTVGFGDITPKTGAARIATMTQMIMDILVIGVIVKVMLDAAQIALRRRYTNGGDPDVTHRTDGAQSDGAQSDGAQSDGAQSDGAQ